MADVGRITELWRAAADALENPRDPLHGWEAAEIENARLLAECSRLRGQLDAARQALEQIANHHYSAGVAREAADAARAALGVEGEQEKTMIDVNVYRYTQATTASDLTADGWRAAWMLAAPVVVAANRYIEAEKDGTPALIEDAHFQLLRALTDYRAAARSWSKSAASATAKTRP